MKKVIFLTLIIGFLSTNAFADRTIEELRGVIQQEVPCVIAEFPEDKGCLRVVTTNGGIYYLNRTDHAPEAEFNVVEPGGILDLVLYQVFFDDLNSILLVQNQPVLVKGEIEAYGDEGDNGGHILKVYSIESTAYLTNENLESTGCRHAQ